jgi:hypothetical protein
MPSGWPTWRMRHAAGDNQILSARRTGKETLKFYQHFKMTPHVSETALNSREKMKSELVL